MCRDDRAWRTGPRLNPRNFASDSEVVLLVEEDTEESGGFALRVWLELGVDIDDERGNYGGDQTSLDIQISTCGLVQFAELTITRRIFKSSEICFPTSSLSPPAPFWSSREGRFPKFESPPLLRLREEL